MGGVLLPAAVEQGLRDGDAERPVADDADEVFALLVVLVEDQPFGMFVNNVSVLALDQVHWRATEVGLLTAGVGVLDIVLQGGLMQILLPRIGERGVIIAGVVAQAVGMLALALVASVVAQPWLLIVGTLALGAGQGPATAALDGVVSLQAGDDEQGWVAGVLQSLNTGLNVVAPLLAGVLYTTLTRSTPYWLGFAMVAAAVLLLTRLRFPSPAGQPLSDTVATDALPG